MKKNYVHEEYVYIITDESKTLAGIIGYSTIRHEDEERPNFVCYKAFYKPRRDGLIQLAKGELRWDGFITGLQNPSFVLFGFDDLVNKIIVEYAIYKIADIYIYNRAIDDHIQLTEIYNDLEDGVLYNYQIEEVTDDDVSNIKSDMKEFCLHLKEELTQMSMRSLSQEGESDET